ncbi:TonB family protein [bacterium]|nr:TonB family protein [bacterium]
MKPSPPAPKTDPVQAKEAPAKPSLPTPKTDAVRAKPRTGLKVETAPSTDPFAPKGAKRPARTPRQKPGEEGSPKPEEKGPQGAGSGKGTPGGGGGGLRIEGDLLFPYPGYLDSLVTRIQDHWEEPLAQGSLKATVFFRILRDGTITDFRVDAPSGSLPFDRSVLDAVIRANPLSPLPEGFRGENLGVYFDFEY